MSPQPQNGVITIPSHHSVEDTVQRVKDVLNAKRVTLFAFVDHSGEAEKVGLRMPPCKLLIFGNPAVGTPVMLAAPTLALDLPLKILVWQDANGAVWVSYNDSAYLQQRHGVPAALLANISVVDTMAAKVAQ
jgi:uncharacterized protein (DUF302 family)